MLYTCLISGVLPCSKALCSWSKDWSLDHLNICLGCGMKRRGHGGARGTNPHMHEGHIGSSPGLSTMPQCWAARWARHCPVQQALAASHHRPLGVQTHTHAHTRDEESHRPCLQLLAMIPSGGVCCRLALLLAAGVEICRLWASLGSDHGHQAGRGTVWTCHSGRGAPQACRLSSLSVPGPSRPTLALGSPPGDSKKNENAAAPPLLLRATGPAGACAHGLSASH